jgi:hypothetical protein
VVMEQCIGQLWQRPEASYVAMKPHDGRTTGETECCIRMNKEFHSWSEKTTDPWLTTCLTSLTQLPLPFHSTFTS